VTERTDPFPSDLRQALARAQSQSGQLRLTLYDRAGSQTLALTPGTQRLLGRDVGVELRLDERGVSALHARLSVDAEGRPWVEDLDSRHGTWVNGVRLEAGAPRDLAPGDRLGIGAAQGVVQSLGSEGRSLTSHAHFLERLEQEIERARQHRRPLSVAMLQAPPGAESHVASWSPPISAALDSYQLVGCYASSCLELLLPEQTLEQAEIQLDALTGALGHRDEPLRRAVCGVPQHGDDPQQLIHALRRALARNAGGREGGGPSSTPPRTPPYLPAERWLPAPLWAAVDRLAPTRATVLIVGETGSGKERLARELHERSPWSGEPFVTLNCAAIPAGLLESTLFGHRAGAFTGANEDRAGVFARAGAGTLFLDGLDNLDLRAQGALLDVLESGHFRPVGSGSNQASEARVIASTRADLAQLAAAGRFRSELRYRLGAAPLILPPLRGRRALVGDLARHFAALSAEENGLAPISIGDDVLRLLGEHRWPGNMRELRNVIERATLLSPDGALRVADLPQQLAAPRASLGNPSASDVEPVTALDGPGPTSSEDGADEPFRERVQRYERALILDALRASGGNQSHAARRLRIPRRTLVHKLRSLGIRVGGQEADRTRASLAEGAEGSPAPHGEGSDEDPR
jgi:DNA-binding NtrC family response regulator